MMSVKIESFAQIRPMIYAYNTPGIPYHEGWTKVGYTEKQSVTQRIEQQCHTANIRWDLAWADIAMYKDGSWEYFKDHDFHSYLEAHDVQREEGTEWFRETGDNLQDYFYKFASRKVEKSKERATYVLRNEQEAAVNMTKAYFENGGEEFLWNAKPRFGKTLSSYDLVRQMKLTNVLIVTNRPSIANSWADDFFKFIGWRDEYVFVSDNDALKKRPGVLSRDEYTKQLIDGKIKDTCGVIAFESLQGLKTSIYFGGAYNKLKWIKDLDFDLLIVDESQEGVDTFRTSQAFKRIKRKHTLYLSGTPFKQLASDQFGKEQIYNWSYADEQEAKLNCPIEKDNPYEMLPRLSLFTYQMSSMIFDKVQQGIQLNGEDETVDYAFDLNEFFATDENKKFIHEEEVVKFLHTLSTNEKYPYSTPELRAELSHTLWLLNRVASCEALKKLLEKDPVFGEYKIVLAAGKNAKGDEEEDEKAFDRVKSAIANNEKTITLSVGQLTVGVTIPEWSAVLMLCNLKSPSSYMQAAFRAQNPCAMDRNGIRVRKETAYIFDFDPSRTLIIFDEFANNLSPETSGNKGTGEDRKENIKRLLNFFPVIGEDDEGKMVELDAAKVLSIPRKLKSQEVVRRGFMCNFLFQNISKVFGAPGIVREIVEKLAPAHEEPNHKKKVDLGAISDIHVDEEGEVEIEKERVVGQHNKLFGEKFYTTEIEQIAPKVEAISKSETKVEEALAGVKEHLKGTVTEKVVATVATEYNMKKGTQQRIEKELHKELDHKFDVIQDDYKQQAKIAKITYDKQIKEAETQEEIKKAETTYQAGMNTAMQNLMNAVQGVAKETLEDKPPEVIERAERYEAEKDKKTVEDGIRAHLRGFARTIPSFIMAYGDENLRLQNFDDYTEDQVFEEVTGISEKDFRFLRDGGYYPNPETGEKEYFEGHLFDETVFDDSIQEFLKKKEELANYFDESHEEDIFDYIPPQKTNQIFTPKWVVTKMVDELEENNPGCFDDPTKTFADLYMKSGLYITEIVKRLFRSEGLKKAYPDEGERIRHILQKQVYGMAPNRIIYLIATNYILGFDEKLKNETKNFVQADAAEAAKKGELQKIVEENFNQK